MEHKRALEIADRALARLWTIGKTETDHEIRIKASLSILRWEEYRGRLLGFDDLPHHSAAAGLEEERQRDRQDRLQLLRAMTRDELHTIREIQARVRERIKAGGRDEVIPPAVIETAAVPVKS
jgi:hypothetical protein